MEASPAPAPRDGEESGIAMCDRMPVADFGQAMRRRMGLVAAPQTKRATRAHGRSVGPCPLRPPFNDAVSSEAQKKSVVFGQFPDDYSSRAANKEAKLVALWEEDLTNSPHPKAAADAVASSTNAVTVGDQGCALPEPRSKKQKSAQAVYNVENSLLPAHVCCAHEGTSHWLKGAAEIRVDICAGLSVSVLEASLDSQEMLVKQAVGAKLGSPTEDPYGVVLWPAAVTVAQALADWAKSCKAQFGPKADPPRILEIGAGCGLVSLAAAKLGFKVMATDYRSAPLELLQESARRQGLEIETEVFDIRDLAVALPSADLVVGSDVFYEKDTACALSHRLAEARRRGSHIIIGQTFRPWREAFVDEFLSRLRGLLGPEADDVELEASHGTAVPGVRHSLIMDPASRMSPGQRIAVDVLRLPPTFPFSQNEIHDALPAASLG